MANNLFNPNLTDAPPPDYVPPPYDDDFEFMTGPADYPFPIPRFVGHKRPRWRYVLLSALLVAVVVIAAIAAVISSQPAASAQTTIDMKDCESGYEVFPEANTTVIYMLSDECSKVRAKNLEEQREFLAKEATPLPPAVKPLEKIDDSLLDEQQ